MSSNDRRSTPHSGSTSKPPNTSEDSGAAGISSSESGSVSKVSAEDKALVEECEKTCLDNIEEDAVKAALPRGYKLYQRMRDPVSGKALVAFVQERIYGTGAKQVCHLEHLLAIYTMAGRPSDPRKKAKRQDWASTFICAAKAEIPAGGFAEWVKKGKLKDFRAKATQIRDEEKSKAEAERQARVEKGELKPRKTKPAPQPYLVIAIRGTGNRSDQPSMQIDLSPDVVPELKMFLQMRKGTRQGASAARGAVDLLDPVQAVVPPSLAADPPGDGDSSIADSRLAGTDTGVSPDD